MEIFFLIHLNHCSIPFVLLLILFVRRKSFQSYVKKDMTVHVLKTLTWSGATP